MLADPLQAERGDPHGVLSGERGHLPDDRPSVSVVIEEFVRRGMLRVERGRVLMGNRDEVRRTSCDCDAVIKHTYEQVGR